jgi:inosose dehydratase
VRRGERPYAAAVGAGLYRPLGEGDARVADLVRLLEEAGYAGWYVLEQDAVLTGEPAPGAGPIADVRTSVGFLHQTAGGAGVPGGAARPQVVRVGERQGEERT